MRVKSFEVSMSKMFVALFVTLIVVGCSKPGNDYDFEGELMNKIEKAWSTNGADDAFLEVEHDVVSGVAQELARQQKRHPNAEVSSVKVNSISIISDEIVDFGYLDELSLYINKANPTDVGTKHTKPEGILIGTMQPDQTNQTYLHLEVKDTELKEELSGDGAYDLFLVGKTNDQFVNIDQDRLAEIKIGFLLRIEA